NDGDFITKAEGAAGLKFTPDRDRNDANGTFSFDVQASVNADDTGLGGSVEATISVRPIADTPSVTNATTNEDTQTSNGLVISRTAADGSEVTHFEITGVPNGQVFLHDGVTPVPAGGFVTFAQASAGLRFTPAADFFGTASFQVQASTSSS